MNAWERKILSPSAGESVIKPEKVHIGMTVRVREQYRIAERRGMVGRIVDHYGGEGYMAVDVRFSGGQRRLFWPEDLEVISSPDHCGVRCWVELARSECCQALICTP